VSLPKHWRPLAAYLILALVILGPTLRPGYILTLDMVFTPNMHLWIIPAWLVQKLMLVAIFTAAGLGLHRLAPTKNSVARYAAGLFYVLNPFTYERLMAGQYLVLAGYALLPWLLVAILAWLKKPGLRQAVPVALITAAIGFLSLHTFGFAAIIIALAALLALWRARRTPTALGNLLLSAALIAGLTGAASSPWLVPLLTGHSQTSASIAGFDTRHFLSFRTQGDAHLGVPGNVLALYGFWGERNDWYTLPKSPYWLLLLAALLALVATGVTAAWRTRKAPTALLLAILILGWVLAQGIMDNPFALLNNWLLEHLPFYRGYREPGKFIALVALAEAYFLAPGVAALLNWLRQKRPSLIPTAAALALVLPVLYTPTMLLGAGGQLTSTDYPADWYALNRTLAAEHSQTKILVLPWHQYLYCDFAGRLIANPSSGFFGPRAIQGDNAEIGLIYTQNPNPTSTFIEQKILDSQSGRTDLAPRLATLNVQYVLLEKTADYPDYSWLDHQPGLTLTQDSKTYRLYRRE